MSVKDVQKKLSVPYLEQNKMGKLQLSEKDGMQFWQKLYRFPVNILLFIDCKDLPAV